MSKNKQSSLWIFGKHPIFLALEKRKRKIYQILATRNSIDELSNFLKKNQLFSLKSKIKLVDNLQIELVIGTNQIHQGLALSCSHCEVYGQEDLFDQIKIQQQSNKKPPTILIMDQLTDPHNIGAIIRSANAFGVTKIVFPENNFPRETATMIKSSSGAIENVDLFKVVNINKLMERLKKVQYWCVGLAGEAKAQISEISKFENIALIIGSEGQGIRSLVKKNCDLLLKIPISKSIESLNASVACSIALYEMNKI